MTRDPYFPSQAVRLAELTSLTFRECVAIIPTATAAGLDDETLVRMALEAFQVAGRHKDALDWLYSCIVMGKRTCL